MGQGKGLCTRVQDFKSLPQVFRSCGTVASAPFRHSVNVSDSMMYTVKKD